MAENNSQKIGLSTATITGMNAMIGAGIFAVPAALATNVGPAGILAFIFVAISVWFVAQSLARAAQLYPEEGSFYTYTKQWAGHKMGLIASASYIIGLLMAMGIVTKMAGIFLQYFFPAVAAHTLGLIALGIIVLINVFGVSLSQLGQRILIFCTVFPILTTIGMCLSKANFSLLTPFAPYGYASVIKATSVVIFGFFGFESAASLFNVVKNPEKNVPKALNYSILLVGLLYTAFIGSIILSTPLTAIPSSEAALPEILKVTFPNHPWLISIVSLSIVSAILGTLHSVVWGVSHLMLSFFKKIKLPAIQNLITKNMLNKKTTVILSGLVVLTAYLTIKKNDLFFGFAAVFIVFAYITSIAALLFVKEEWTSKRNIKTIIGIITAAVMFGFAIQGVIAELAKLA